MEGRALGFRGDLFILSLNRCAEKLLQIVEENVDEPDGNEKCDGEMQVAVSKLQCEGNRR